MSVGRIVVDGTPIEFQEGDSVAVAILRGGEVPGHGGCLCLAGDCGNCLAEVDGIAYVRSCQVDALPGTVVRRHPRSDKPPLPVVDATDLSRVPRSRDDRVARMEVDTVVIGSAGWAPETSAATVLDAAEGFEVVGLYPGPSVVARMPLGMLHLHAEKVVVATGAAETQPVCPGSNLAGIVTARAAERLKALDVDLGRLVRVGRELVRFEGSHGRVQAVVTRAADGSETTSPCDTAVVELGRAPRDVLARMSSDSAVTRAGSVGDDFPLPPPPTAGIVCPCMGTTVADLETAFDKGYTDSSC